MRLLADPVVDWGDLLDVVWTALLGGIGVTAAFAVALYGAVRATDARRNGTIGLATGYWVLMAWRWRWCWPASPSASWS